MNDRMVYQSPLGKMIAVSDGEGIIGMEFMTGKNMPVIIREQTDLTVFCKLKHWLDEYFCGRNPDDEGILLKPEGTLFQIKIWAMVRDIPFGQTVTYGELARRYTDRYGGKYMSAQAVGGAVAHNPIALLIPCHRVVGANGVLSGYRWGMALKRKLLFEEERQNFNYR